MSAVHRHDVDDVISKLGADLVELFGRKRPKIGRGIDFREQGSGNGGLRHKR